MPPCVTTSPIIPFSLTNFDILSMAPPLLLLSDIHLTFGGTPLLEGAEMSVSAGERLCLVGRNGSGKSTLLKIAAAQIDPDAGERFLQPGATVRYLPQEPDLSAFATVWDYIADGLAPGDNQQVGRRILAKLSLTGDEGTGDLSGGETRRAALVRILAPEPDILLLDEPTNHLDLPAIEWLEMELRTSRAAVVLISHDRRFLETLSKATVWIDRGVCRRLDKGFAHFEEWRDGILEDEEVLRHKMDRKIARETRWLNRGVTARRKRNMGRLRALIQLRKDWRNLRRAAGMVEMTALESRRSGKRVIEAKGIVKAYDGNTVVKDFSTRILRGDRIGIVGPNGTGKTTLLNMLTGNGEPDAGTVDVGSNIDLVTLDQKRESLEGTTRLADALTGKSGDSVTVGGQQKHVMSYMQDFLFAPEQARTQISALSGGERGRLMLARAFARPSNVLVLDEPTNDLDLETLDLLQELLADYNGTVILVSHDRDFLDRVVTSVIASEGSGRWVEYAGGYTDMLMQRGDTPERETVAALKPRAAAPKDKKVPKTKTKLSYKDQYMLETLPGEMEMLQGAIDRHQATLAETDLFTRDPVRFRTAADGLAQAEVELSMAEDRWLELEILRDEMEGN